MSGVVRRIAFELYEWYLSPYEQLSRPLKIVRCLSSRMVISLTDMKGILDVQVFHIDGLQWCHFGRVPDVFRHWLFWYYTIDLECDLCGWQYEDCNELSIRLFDQVNFCSRCKDSFYWVVLVKTWRYEHYLVCIRRAHPWVGESFLMEYACWKFDK